MNHVTDGAVGVSNSKWYVAIVRPNHERKVADYLDAVGFQTYVASQQRLRIYTSGRKKWVWQILIPSKIFVYCTDKDRHVILQSPEVLRFMTNPSGRMENGHRPLAVISSEEIDALKFMLGQREVPVSFHELTVNSGDAVKIIRGSLRGLEGTVIESSSSQKEIVVKLDLLGCAKVVVPSTDLELLKT